MATYFHGSNSEIQSSGDGLQTLYLMNPTYVPSYTDAPQQHQTTPNMLLLNSHALNLANLSHAPPLPPSPNQHHQQQHVNIHGVTNIIGPNHSDDDHTRPPYLGHPEITTAFHGFSAASATAPRVHYNLWGQVIEQPPSSAAATSNSISGGGLGFRRPSQQGLSLSLSSQQTGYRSLSGEVDIPGHAPVAGIGNSPSSVSNGVSTVHGVILGSKFLKATQELLDEVVNVGKGIYKEDKFGEGANKEKMKVNRESATSGVGDGSSGGGENSAGKQVAELSTAQRQELQMKKSKLVNMLDEVSY